MIRRAVPLALLAVLSLAACGEGDAPGSTPSPTGSTSSSPASPSPEITPSPSDQPSETSTTPQGPVTIESPTDGATVSGPEVMVSGVGTAFEGTLNWQVLDDGGVEVSNGFTTGGANGEIGPYEFTVTLEPGTYVVEVWEPDMSDGESGQAERRSLVTAGFTVA